MYNLYCQYIDKGFSTYIVNILKRMYNLYCQYIEPVPVEPVERFRRNRQGHHIVCSPPLWLDQSNKELWLAVE